MRCVTWVMAALMLVAVLALPGCSAMTNSLTGAIDRKIDQTRPTAGKILVRGQAVSPVRIRMGGGLEYYGEAVVENVEGDVEISLYLVGDSDCAEDGPAPTRRPSV